MEDHSKCVAAEAALERDEMTGILKVTNGNSRINGTLLAREGAGDPFGNATAFLSDNDCEDDDCVTVTGTQRTNAFFIDTAVREIDSKCARVAAIEAEPAEAELLAAPGTAKSAAGKSRPSKSQPPAKKKPQKKTKRAAPKKAKKSTTKSPSRGSTKKAKPDFGATNKRRAQKRSSK